MNVKFCLAFPREAVSVPVMRRVLGDTLRNLGVVDECIGDILVAVTEACTNVLRHGDPARRYEVVTSVGVSGCLVEVLDSGRQARPRRSTAVPATPPGPAPRAAATVAQPPPVAAARARPRSGVRTASRPDDQMIAQLPESGRGLQIMRALVDDVTMRTGPGRSTVVSMRKRLAWRQDAPLAGLSDGELRNVG